MSSEVQKSINKMSSTVHGQFGVMPQPSLSTNELKKYFSRETEEVMKKIRELEENSISISQKIHDKRVTLDEKLFDAKANVKILLSQVSMHFSNALREKLFHQIDLLHDPDDWEDGDTPIQLQSFKTFLRWFYLYKPPQLPNFGLSDTGHFIASWLTNHNKDSLILEYCPNDRITWFVTEYYDDEPDYGSGSTNLSRIAYVLSSYHSEKWFDKNI
jgi:hypothetical protein